MKFESSNCSFSSVATIFWCASLLLVGWFPTLVTGIRIKGHESDEEALLAIKSQINHDPFGVTKSWNRSVAMCRWHGITCAPRHQRVTKLNLSQKGLRGSLSPYVGNLSFLRFIILQDNNFHGVIPPEIGRLPRLETLSLYNNSFGGRIPPNLTHCSNLILFRASSNKLIGNIPVELGKLVKLENLEIAHNNLTGHLPTSLGNVSTLQDINLEGNYLEGGLQVTLGFLKRLAVLKLDTNNFSGFFPPSIFNLSSLRLLSLVDNQLSGSLPFSLGYSLPNLSGIYIGGNYFSGTLPVSLSNASKLQGFDISYNHFSGSVSISFRNAHNLTWLNMESNDLGGGTTDLDFITTMTNCSKLEVISLAANKFSGLLPNSIANLSISLQQLSLGENHITGSIPLGIANLVNLIGIGLAENRLTGTIPASLGMLKKLQTLYLGGNTLTGTIPASVGNLSVLTRMTLEENLLEGSIPAEFGRCQILIMMALGSNKLTGSVPKEIFSIPTLSIALDLSDNLLIGSIPSDIGNLVNLVYLNISNNNFSGHIPAALSGCTTLETLSLGENHFDGSIPDSLSSLRSIAELDLSSNNLSGQIPDYLEKLSFLKYLNLSHNRFEGPVPTKGVFNNASAVSLTRNGRLCGGIAELHLPSCPFTHPKDPKTSVPLKLIWIVCGVLGILMLSSLLFCWLRKRGVKAKPSLAFRLGNSIMMVSFHQLLKATDGFAPANLLGQGSFGNVYKGNLYQNQEQNVIAVKVMNLQVQGASRSFLTECKTLRNVRHRNLVKIISACSSIDFQGNPFKALIYEFIPNGSLHQWLHDTIQHGEPKILNFLQRLNIAIDVALALDYLHHHCEVPVVHCDLKPSNILLDHDMVAGMSTMASSSLSLFLLLLYYFFFSSCASQAISQFKGIDLGSPALDVNPAPLYGHSSVHGSKDVISCDRIRVSGHSRLMLRSYASSVRVTLAPSVLIPERLHSKIHVCFHRNASLGLCKCEHENWKAVEKGIWLSVMSPYDDRFIDVKFIGDVSGSVTVALEEDFQRWRLVFLALGFVLLLLAPFASKWVPFYYSSSMAIGIILVIIILLFQGMKLLPTGRKNIFYLGIYVPVLGAGSFLLHHFSGLVNSILVNFGLSEEMHNPVAIFVLVVIILLGAALGYWMVRKFVISNDGSVDVGVAQFVKWAMRIVAATFIFQSTLDTRLAVVVLASSSAICSLITSTRRNTHMNQPRSWDEGPWVHRSRPGIINQGRAEFFDRSPRMYPNRTLWNGHTPLTSLTWNKFPARGGISDQNYYSSFHKTRNRKKFTKQEWKDFTRESTRHAIADLAATPEFTDWMIEHADRIKLLPCDSSEESVGSKSNSSDYDEEGSSSRFRLFNL